MSKAVINCIYAAFPKGQGKLRPLAVALANYGRDDGTRIYPSVSTLSACIDQCERTVQSQLQKLLAIGWLQLVQHAAGGGRGRGPGRPREYRINPDWLATAWAQLRQDSELRGAEQPVPWSPAPRKPRQVAPAPVCEVHDEESGAEILETGAKSREMHAAAAAPELRTTEETTPPCSPPQTGDAAPAESTAESMFLQVIEAYPTLRVDMHRARRAWQRHVAGDQILQATIVGCVQRLAATPEWQTENGRFVPKLSKWIRNRGWLNPDAQPPRVVEARSLPTVERPAQETPEQIEHRRRMAAQVKATYHANRRQELNPERAQAAYRGTRLIDRSHVWYAREAQTAHAYRMLLHRFPVDSSNPSAREKRSCDSGRRKPSGGQHPL